MKDFAIAGHPVSRAVPTSAEDARSLDAEELFREHAAFIAAFLRRMGVADADVDDVVQEVFLVAHRKGGYAPGPAKPRSWLAAIAVRLSAASRRKRMRRREEGEEALESTLEPGPDPERSLQLVERLQRVDRALSTLDDDHRAAFVLYEIEGFACTEIATALDIPVGTVYSRLHKARKRFVDAYPVEPDEGGP